MRTSRRSASFVRGLGPVLGSLVAFSLASTSPRAARADTVIAGDAELAMPRDSDASRGEGFGVRLGRRLDLPLFVGGPEIGGSFTTFPGDASLKVTRGFAGLRLGVGEVVRPGVFGHVGLGHVSWDAPGASGGTSFGWDAGAFLDFTLLPFVNLGAHGAWVKQSQAGDAAAFSWLTAGVHVELVL